VLLYRPLVAAYQQSGQAPARRFILREFADPQLHAEPDELLGFLEKSSRESVKEEPARLLAEVNLRERALTLRLTTRDHTWEVGGLWTALAGSRSLMNWMAASSSVRVRVG
jgi:hypothetical protein